MNPRWLLRPILAAAAGAVLYACVDGVSPVEQDLRLRGSFAILPDYSASGAFGQTAEITRIRLTARDAATDEVVPPTPSVFDVDPSLEEWDLPLELEVGDLENGQVIILMELISVVGGVETVEFSGETAPLGVTAGSTQQVARAEVHPGNPENLAATSVEITGEPDDLLEGDDAALSASVGGVSAPDVFWTVLDPTLAEVEKTGATSAVVTGLLPGTARVVAAAGTRRDTIAVAILQRPVSVVLTPDAVELASLDQETEFDAQVLDTRGDPVTGAEVTWEVDGPAVVEHLGNGRFRAVENGATDVVATVVGFPAVSGTADVSVAQVAASVTVTPDDATLEAIDETVELEALVEDALGNPIDGFDVVWSSEDEDIVSVNQNGIARAEAEGAVDVTATAGSATGSAEITVHQRVAEVEVEPGSHTFESIGDSHAFTATVLDPNGHPITGRAVAWSSSDEDVVDVDADGTATAVGDGDANVTAVVEDESGAASVEVDQRAAEIEVAPGSRTFTALGDVETFTAEARDARGNVITGRTPEWSSSDDDVVSINDDGEATARGNGTATLTAEMDGETATAAVTVEQAVVRIEVAPSAHTLVSIGETVTLAAVAFDANDNEVDGANVDWASDAAAVASVNDAGVVTAESNGDATITASVGEHSANAAITVDQVVAEVVVTPADAEIDAIGDTQQFAAEAHDALGNVVSGENVVWSIAPANVATIDDDGLAEATGTGTATVTATVGGESGEATLTVTQVIASMTLDPDAHTFASVGESLQLAVIALDRRGREIDPANLEIEWQTSNDDVVTVDANGMLTAAGAGTARVTASVGEEDAFADITVEQEVDGIIIDPGFITLDRLGETLQLTATATDANGNEIEGIEFEWSTSDADVATVDDDGLVTTQGNGTVTIQAEFEGIDADATITVRQSAASILLDPATASIGALGQTRTLVATVLDANGRPIEDATVGFLSLNPDVATVDGAGVVTAITEGTARIEAREQGKLATADITVSQIAAIVEVTPANHQFGHVGDTVRLAVIVRDSTGHEMHGEHIVWSSTDTTVARVDSTGFVTAVGHGSATIHATVQGVTGSATVELQGEVVEGVVDRVLVISGGHTDDNSRVVAELSELMPDVTFEQMFTNTETPTLEYLNTFDVVLVYENGNFGNVTNVGNAVAQYVDDGGNVVLGVFLWQDWGTMPNTGTDGWGLLQNMDPFFEAFTFYSAGTLDGARTVTHPITNGIESLSVDNYRGGVGVAEGTTVLAWWTDNVPLIGIRTGEAGQRIVSISAFPGHYNHGSFSGDFTQLWVNALNWAGAANPDNSDTSFLRAQDSEIRRSVPALNSAALPATGGTNGRVRSN